MPNDQDFSSELDDYLAKSNQEQPAWIRDEETGVYVDHSKQVVMYTQEDGAWACGDYNQFYPNRYIYDTQTQAWLDTITSEYSFYDDSTHTYVPLTDAYWQGHPQGTGSMRLVVQSSPFFKQGQVVLIDENGITIGRDRSWDSRLRLPEMIVSKYHAMIYRDKQEKLFYMIDNGSQHGTFINEKRLSEPKQASLPYELRNMDIVRIGSTSLQVHLHAMGWPCQGCLASELIETSLGKKEKQQQQQVTVDLEESRREWIKNQKKMYQSDLEESNIYIDRAKIRRTHTKPEKFIAEEHYDDTPRPVAAAAAAVSYHTPVSGIGSKMLQKLGWQEGQSLGKHGDGILEPIRPSTQSSRSGLGVTTQPDMNMNESKKEKQWRLAQERYKNNFT
ncbi:hypothetical protein INT48_008307 [Thamnidium elegans]|uniref:Angiogenic factor with G patch and FHA domains 1 n=1 Tax=Thamnidium elegans TaxID=101142 RepID=A0A8H7VPE8_9FUNG|nr:hypothetical protein INT48_008307 [Thamnidium elegans]